MRLYTTCRVCKKLLDVVEVGQERHPNCEAKPTVYERFRQAVVDEQWEIVDELAERVDRVGPARLLDAALVFVDWGWPVFPLKPGEKVPATRNGFKDATADPDRIRAWWRRHPTSNIGLPAGHAFDVIDVDMPKPRKAGGMTEGGMGSLDVMRQADAIPPVHARVATPSGGGHLYVAASGEGNRAGILPGIDIRGRGGYVVAPPSVDERTGGRYQFISKPSPVITTGWKGRPA